MKGGLLKEVVCVKGEVDVVHTTSVTSKADLQKKWSFTRVVSQKGSIYCKNHSEIRQPLYNLTQFSCPQNLRLKKFHVNTGHNLKLFSMCVPVNPVIFVSDIDSACRCIDVLGCFLMKVKLMC